MRCPNHAEYYCICSPREYFCNTHKESHRHIEGSYGFERIYISLTEPLMHKYLQMFFRRIKFYNDLKDFYIHISHEILTIIQQKIQHIIENIHNIINKLDKEANNIRQTLKVFHETSEDFKVYQNDTPQIDPAQYDITPIIHMLDTFFKNDVEELSSSYKSLPCQKLNELAYSRYAKTDLKLKILKLAGVNVRGRKDINHLVISSNGELAVTCEENLVKY